MKIIIFSAPSAQDACAGMVEKDQEGLQQLAPKYHGLRVVKLNSGLLNHFKVLFCLLVYMIGHVHLRILYL